MIYQLLIRLLSPLVLIYLLLEMRKRKGGSRFILQRLGFNYQSGSDVDVWFHCASVGEVKAIEPLVDVIKNSNTVLVTTSTATGYRALVAKYGPEISHCYLPFDWPYAVKNFLNAYKPSRLLLAETEIWPNLLRQAIAGKCRIDIVNGRMSEKTTRAPNWLKSQYKQALKNVDLILVRSEVDATRFISIGAEPQLVKVVGNIKYSPSINSSFKKPIQSKYILFASSREHEEKLVVEQWLQLDRPELLVIVPRHPERRDVIVSDLITASIQQSEIVLHSSGQSLTSQTRIYIDDRMGVLLPLFEHAEMVIMGGSFVNKGGHNILEPAAFGKLVLVGPYMSDFEDEVSLLKENNGIIQCETLAHLQARLVEYLTNPIDMHQIGRNAKSVIESQSNVIDRYISYLKL